MPLLLTACSAPLHRFDFTRLCMGVQTRIVAFATEKQPAESAAAAAFERIDALDAIMSDYRRGSELNRLSEAAGGPAIPVSVDLYAVLSEAQRISDASGGAFDITVGPEVALWRESRRLGKLPDDAALERARSLVGCQRLHLDPSHRTAQLDTPGMRLDLGGIAKGYAAEQAVASLRARGLNRCLVSLAGDVFAGDPPPNERGWRIEVRGEQDSAPSPTLPNRANSPSPHPPISQSPHPSILLISNSAISTSGDTEQFIELAGRRYSHIINPLTGLGIQDRRSVTVLAPHGARADALATPACIIGPEATRAMLAQFPGTAAVIEEPLGAGLQRTTIDPGHLFNWLDVAAPAEPR